MAIENGIFNMVHRIKSKEFQIVGLPKSVADPGLFASRKAAEVWLQGKADLLALIGQRRPRACLCCGKGFESEGFHNRLCNPCRNRGSAELDPVGYGFGGLRSRRRGGQ